MEGSWSQQVKDQQKPSRHGYEGEHERRNAKLSGPNHIFPVAGVPFNACILRRPSFRGTDTFRLLLPRERAEDVVTHL